jgi:hypothetical protein
MAWHGSDAMNPDPSYPDAYVVLPTQPGDAIEIKSATFEEYRFRG